MAEMREIIRPSETDARMGWPPGRTASLIRQRQIPFYVVPDGSHFIDIEELRTFLGTQRESAGVR